MANKELAVSARKVLGKKVKALRRTGVTPANIYGHKIESTAVQADTAALTHLLRGSTRNAIIDLRIEGEPTGAARGSAAGRARRRQYRDPARRLLPDLDDRKDADRRPGRPRRQLARGRHVRRRAAADAGAVPVEALPGDIPAQFDVDVSTLTELEQSYHIRDIAVDATKVAIQIDPDVVLARVASPRLATAEETAAETAGRKPPLPPRASQTCPAGTAATCARELFIQYRLLTWLRSHRLVKRRAIAQAAASRDDGKSYPCPTDRTCGRDAR